jgi:hypothetical protein
MMFFNWTLVAVNLPPLKLELELLLSALLSFTALTSNAAGAAVKGAGGWDTGDWVAPIWAEADAGAALGVA